MPNLASLLHPINRLLQSGVPWKWTKICQQASNEAKRKLAFAPVLTHYDPGLPIHMAYDASQYRVGPVISHIIPDRSECLITLVSCTLSPIERNYAQVEKERLSLVFGT